MIDVVWGCNTDNFYVESDMEDMARLKAVIEHCATEGAMITPELVEECNYLLTLLDDVHGDEDD